MKKNTPKVTSILDEIQTYYQQQNQDGQIKEKKIMHTKKQNLQQLEGQYKLKNLGNQLNEITAKQSSQLTQEQNSAKQPEKNEVKKSYIPNQQNKVKKLKLCKQFISTGQCRYGVSCPYAHSKKELDAQYLPDAVKNLLAMGADPTFMDWNGYDSIMHSIKKNLYEVMCSLIDLSQIPIDFNKRFFTSKQTYLIIAAKLGQADMVISLLAQGANPNIQDYQHKSAIFYSIEISDFESIYALVEHKAQLSGTLSEDSKQKKILFFAAENNMLDLISILHKRGVSQSEKDKDGNNLLILAFINQHYDLVYELIESMNMKQQIHQCNKRGDNLLILALKNGNLDMSKYLIQQSDKGQLDYQDKEGKTALMYAAEHGYHDILELLLEKQVEPNKTDKHGKTALMLACKNSNLLCVESILEMKSEQKYQQQVSTMQNSIDFSIENANLKKQSQVQVIQLDSYGLSARNYAQNHDIRQLINQFMIDTGQLSESFSKELEQEKYKLDAFFSNPRKESQSSKRGIRGSQKFLASTGTISRKSIKQ